jgi:hypothetical protein
MTLQTRSLWIFHTIGYQIRMKSTNKPSKFEGITIGNEHTGPEKVEYVCSWCNRSLVRLTDKK